VNGLFAAGFFLFSGLLLRALDVWEPFCCGIAQSGRGFLCYKQLVGKSDPVYSDILAWFTVGDAADAA
jgi:hypothetical protein